MAPAVSEAQSSSSTSLSSQTLPPLHPQIHRTSVPASFHFGLNEQPPWRASTSQGHKGAPPLHYIRLHSPVPANEGYTADSQERSRRPEPSHTYHFRPRRRPASPDSPRTPLNPYIPARPRMTSPDAARYADEQLDSTIPRTRDVNREAPYLNSTDSTLTEEQNHQMRSSPPIQPGEQTFPGKLPSFSEFLNTTRANTPPRTPSRRTGSATSSPQTKQYFDDVAWTDSKRRRVDTLGDIYARPSAAEQPAGNPQRISSVIDPALVHYGSNQLLQHRGAQVVVPVHHHRPSHSYPPAPQSSVPASTLYRHRSPPGAPRDNADYTQQPRRQSVVAPNPYPPSMVQHGAIYEQRPSYYQEPQSAVYGYERPHESYYPQTSYPGPPHSSYDNSYGDIRFQQHVGLDQSAFNRKRRGNLPKEATNVLKDWFARNRSSPYPTEDQKIELCNKTGLSLNQVSNWFINARRRAPQKELREREANNPET
ncbi:Nn.00g106380.m01.CDS01 [Neocucurbitaria sp. VM-36]